jgi:hypothetical protein
MGETFILVFGQALYLGDKLQHTLICPNQVRHNGVIVDDIPRHLSHDGRSTHSIIFPDEDVHLPLKLCGVISYLDTRYPTQAEVDNCRWLILTNDNDWEPYDDSFPKQETIACNQLDLERPQEDRNILSMNTSPFDDHYSNIYRACHSISTAQRKLNISDETIAKTFLCSPKDASRTRQVTTQKGIRSMSDNLCRRFRTKQATLRYNQLGGRYGRFYSDTMFSTVKSLQGATAGQIFVNDTGYTYFKPMKSKSEVGNVLLEFIKEVGIPHAIHTNNAKELTLGKWHNVCKDHGIRMSQTEPYSPFQNRAEVPLAKWSG